MSVQRKKGGHQYQNTLTISAAHTAKQHDLHCISVVLMVGMSFLVITILLYWEDGWEGVALVGLIWCTGCTGVL